MTATVADAVRAILIADAAVSALVGTRVWAVSLDQGELQTSITFQRISADRTHSHDGPAGLNLARMQVDCWGATYADADNLSDAVRLAMDGYSGTVGGIVVQNITIANQTDLFEDETSAHRVSLDFLIWHEETV